MTTRTERRKAKLRFIGLYAVSLLLLVTLASAFWQRLAPKSTQGTVPQTTEKETWFLPVDTAFHAKMNAMNELAASYVKARKDGAQPDMSGWLLLRQSLGKTLDSLDQQAGYLTDGPKKTMMTSVAANFRKTVFNHEAVVNGIMTFPKGNATANVPASTAAVDSLKRLLQERDELVASLQKQAQLAATNNGATASSLQLAITERDRNIAGLQNQISALQTQIRQKDAALQAASNSKSATNNTVLTSLQAQIVTLQNQLKQKDAALQAAANSKPVANNAGLASLQNQVTTLQNQLRQKDLALQAALASKPAVVNSGGEWQQKYQSLKTSFDKVAASEKSLKGAYQTLADDNRRLLSQLQSARKG